MEIKKKIESIILTLILFLVIFSALIYSWFGEYRWSEKQASVANKMVAASLNGRLIANDYLLHPGGRSETQWRAEQDSIKKLIELNIHLDTPTEIELIRKIQNNLISASATFDLLVLLDGDVSKTPLRIEKENQLMEELTLKTQETTLFSSQLAEFNEKEEASFLEYIIVLFSSMVILFFIVLVGSFRVIWKSINLLDGMKTEAQREKDRIGALMQSIGDGVFAIDRSWNITLWNKAAQELTGWKTEEVMGKPFRSIVKFTNKDTTKENIVFIEEAMLYGEARAMENHTILIRKDGQEIPVGDSASPIFNDDGKVAGCIIVFRDMSKEIGIEKVKEDFTFRIVHDLRSPLTVMKSVLESEDIVKKCGEEPDLKEGWGLLNDATKQMLGMVNELLSTIKSQKVGSSIKKIAITDVIKDIARTFKPVASSKGVNYEYVPQTGLPMISVPDPEHIKEIFRNIFSNAIKYNKDNGSIIISHEIDDKFLRTNIGDTGMGISEDNLKKIFTPYSRVNEREGIQGTGLGLYIVKKLVEEAKGKIEVASKEGVGTTFSVYLPIET